MSNAKKIALILLVSAVILLVVFGGSSIGKFLEINKNIATNLAKDPHAEYFHDDLSIDYIKNNTGTSRSINEKELPQAFQPFKEVVHPPFRQGACLICHAPKKDKVVALVTKNVESLCYKCHPPVKKVDFELNCNKCHSPHEADRKKLVRNKVIEEECPAGEFQTPTGVVIKRPYEEKH